MKKLIIYLDQNFISNIAKLKTSTQNTVLNQKLQGVFEMIKNGVNEEKFVVPDSFIQHMETAKIENNLELIDLIYDHLKYLGQITFLQPWEIEDRQFYDALLSYCGKQKQGEESWKAAFNENPDKRMENFDITVKMPNIDFDFNTKQKLQEIRDTEQEYEVQYLRELEVARTSYKENLRTEHSYTLRYYGVTIEEAEKFIDSDEFAKIPYLNIYSRLWAKNISKEGKKEMGEGDFNDIQMLSAYLPYCDVLATDKYMKSLVETLGLDKKYNCSIFSMKTEQLDDLISFLKKEIEGRKPANHNLFSVVCYSEDGENVYSFDVLKRLVTAKNKFENTGKYCDKEINTTVYLVRDKDEIKMPDTNVILQHGPSVLNLEQRKEMFIFLSNGIKNLFNPNNEVVESLIRKIPKHLIGEGVALLEKNTPFDKELIEYDSDLFYDIEAAIEKHAELTEKYKIKIIYS